MERNKYLMIGFNDKLEPIKFPLKMLNRHGLVAGSTGSGKTKTVQVIAEQLSQNGIPSIHLDLKGDLSGLAAAGTPKPFISERYKRIGIKPHFAKSPVQIFALSGSEKGYKLTQSLRNYGADYFGRLLDLNGTQTGLMQALFNFATDDKISLDSLDDLIELILWAVREDGGRYIGERYGRMSGASLSTCLRKIQSFKNSGGDDLFGQDSFQLETFIRHTPLPKKRGYMSIVRATEIQDKPEMFSGFLVKLLMYLYNHLPEVGDLDKPKLVLFLDEAHLIFRNGSKDLINRIESVVRLIRSKGVGVFFCSQNFADIPQAILGQLGFKAQHSVRAFTAKDRQMLRKAAENFPTAGTAKEIESSLTSLNIAEALVSGLDGKGNPTMTEKVYLLSPQSRMGILSDEELDAAVTANNDYLNQYKTPTAGMPLGQYIKENQAAIQTAASLNAKFDYYQTIKVVNSSEIRVNYPVVNQDTPPTPKKEHEWDEDLGVGRYNRKDRITRAVELFFFKRIKKSEIPKKVWDWISNVNDIKEGEISLIPYYEYDDDIVEIDINTCNGSKDEVIEYLSQSNKSLILE